LAEQVVKEAIERLLEIGLLETVDPNGPEIKNLAPHPGAAIPQDHAAKRQDAAVEGKRKEHHHQEGKNTERKEKRPESNRAELNGTEGARDRLKSDSGSQGMNDTCSSLSNKGSDEEEDDDDEPKPQYATPEDELKAIYSSKAKDPIPLVVLDAIRVNLELTQVTMDEFVAELKKHHIDGNWRSPSGFLRDLSKRFRSKTRVASAPVTAIEAEEKNYRCSICASTVHGEGARLIDGKFVPCSCANQEYISRKRKQGVFSEETRQ
jgi:hypothetical protein